MEYVNDGKVCHKYIIKNNKYYFQLNKLKIIK